MKLNTVNLLYIGSIGEPLVDISENPVYQMCLLYNTLHNKNIKRKIP